MIPGGLVDGMALVVDGANCELQGVLAVNEELDALRGRLEHTTPRPNLNLLSGCGALVTEAFWSNRPRPTEARLLDPKVGCGR
jgi:hypothetical protein